MKTTPEQIAAALESAQWPGVSIGNKVLIAAAIECLRSAPAAAKPSTCCPGHVLIPMHSTDTKLCTGCKTEKHWPLEPGQKRTY